MHVSRTISVAICGVSQSGKTALTARLRNRDFIEEYVPTRGTDLSAHHVPDEKTFGAFIRLQIQDLSGDKKYESTTKIFYPRRTAMYFVIDPTLDLDPQLKMLEGVVDQITMFEGMLAENPECLLFLVQTKSDLQTEQEKLKVAAQLQEFIKQQAEKMRMFELFVTSAKTNDDPGIKKLLEATLYNTKHLTQKSAILPKIRNSDNNYFSEALAGSFFNRIYPGMKHNFTLKFEEAKADPIPGEKPEGSVALTFRIP
jgi:small GTP-binding protein